MAKTKKPETKIHAFIQKYFMIIVLFAIMLIPSIYTVLFLGSMWDPYGNTGNLPVAVVNEDVPIVYDGREINIGGQLCDKLKTNDSLQFNFVDEEVALRGLENSTYYMVMVIPADFSANSTTLTSNNPQKMEIEYYVNPGTNYIASKFGESAIKSIKEQINKTVINTYATTIYSKLDTIGAGFNRAADGSDQIYNGVGLLRDGNGQLTDGLSQLGAGCLTLKEGTGTLEDGLKTYTDGVAQVADGVAQLHEGSPQLVDGANQLLDGLNTMSEQVGSSLTEENLRDLETLEAGLIEINDGIQTLQKAINEDYRIDDEKIEKVREAISEVEAIVNTEEFARLCEIINYDLVDWDEVNEILDFVEQFPEAEEYKDTIERLKEYSVKLKEVQELGEQVSPTKAQELISKANSVIDAYGQLTEGVQKLSDGGNMALPVASDTLKKMTNGLLAVQNGLDRTKAVDGETGLIEGMTSLRDGLVTADNGIDKLYNGTQQLKSNNSKLNNGASRLNDGALQLADGSTQLYDGTLQLDDGCGRLLTGINTLETSLKDGANQIEATNTGDNAAEMFAQPVEANENFQRTINSNGEAMSAYMMCAGLWVACLAFCLMFSPFKTSLASRKTFIRHAFIALFVAVVSSALMVTLIMAIDGMRPAHTAETFLVAALAGIAFMSIVYMLNTMFDSIGSFLLLILLVFQLSGSAGTYPIQLSPKFYQIIHPFMPFTYGVHGFRSAISTGNSILPDIAVLVGITAVCVGLTVLTYELRKRKVARKEADEAYEKMLADEAEA